MALVVVRGAIFGEIADQVAMEAMVALLIFSVFGWVAGWITEYVVRDSMETAFRHRVEWYRQGIIDATLSEDKSSNES
ncbi:hypothetical protein Pla52o_02780 [Novipirellula galeiformis]|uniref:Uncharacterized protein n=1 Tax=Novipirellula galeiformis TaxID=2528004 RepID=A0A5C6CR98_9BACT|nr:hypothetical protein [Novipirellula galeiformis]TWU26425.1 hypothetical protein Pla52o_02780 [Novipirellula galeiformis]